MYPRINTPLCRHLSIPSREGEVKRTLRVAPGLSFRSDNYVSDGPIEITISFTTDFCADPEFIENKKIMEPSVQDEPTRFIFSAPPSSEERVFTVAWKNSHWISSRNIVYCLEATTETDGLSRSPSDRSFSDTPHKMAEAPVYKVMTVEGIIVEGGHSPRKNAIWCMALYYCTIVLLYFTHLLLLLLFLWSSRLAK